MHKAIAEYGVGSILNVYDQALPLEKWHEILRAIQAEAKNTRLQIPVLYGIDSIHGTTYVEGGTLFPSAARDGRHMESRTNAARQPNLRR